MTIEDRLTIYGPATCHCGKRKETVFAGERYQLSCRNHPRHPRGKHEGGPTPMEDKSKTAPTRQTRPV